MSTLSIVMPALDEGPCIAAVLAPLQALRAQGAEIIRASPDRFAISNVLYFAAGGIIYRM